MTDFDRSYSRAVPEFAGDMSRDGPVQEEFKRCLAT